ncbi:hypothetical protein WR25_15792 [Diploscapter pachys]|uniref:mitogen-activated protein kinase kinase n=1 Tax=Diploscapter pachys TaxID=2018661 RepID=A0A2A2LXB6_9BILA|nr:hypothetical protein WR25_15792 [Diploscapter pachys]
MEPSSFQRRIKEFEARIRKWRQQKFGTRDISPAPQNNRRSTSQEPHKILECHQTRLNHLASPARRPVGPPPPLPLRAVHTQINQGFFTSPMERKQISTPASLGEGSSTGSASSASPSRANLGLNFSIGGRRIDPEVEILQKRLKDAEIFSGKFTIDNEQIEVRHDDIHDYEELGMGVCGTVYRCIYKGKLQMAVKQMIKSEDKNELKRELADLKVMGEVSNHPSLVYCYGYIICPRIVNIYMELLEKDCEKMLKMVKSMDCVGFPEYVIAAIAHTAMLGLQYLKEDHNIIHRDIKPSNLIFGSDGKVRLCDFGLSVVLQNSLAHTVMAGCPPYMAPERLDATNARNQNYDVRSDVWSLGLTLFELNCGKYPYPLKHGNEMLTLVSITDDDPPRMKSSEASEPFHDFYQRMLVKDYQQRARYPELLEHLFIKRANPSENDYLALRTWYIRNRDLYKEKKQRETDLTANSSDKR